MENRITVTLTMSANEYTALAKVIDSVGFVVSERQQAAMSSFLRVRESMAMHAEDSA